MSELTPITRVESYLDAIINSGIPPTEDITRIETFLQAIYDNVVCELTPITRIEMFLGKISGQDIVLPEPITRIELYLAAIAGEDVELPEEPITRIEMYLAEWADSGDLTTISGAIVEFITQRAHKLKSCVVSLSPQQDLHGYDSPWPEGGGSNIVDKIASEDFGGTVSADGLTATSKVYTATAGFNMARCVINNPFNVTSGDVLYISFDIRLLSGTIERAGLQPIGGQSYAAIGTGKYDIVPTSTKQRVFASTTINTTTDFRGIYIQGVNGTDAQIEISNIKVAKTADYVWTPYSNICPISGWTGCEVTRTGKSISPFTVETMTATINYNGFAGWHSGWKVPDRTGVFTYSVYIDNTNAVDTSAVSVWFRGSDNITFVDGTSQFGTLIQAGAEGVSTVTIDMSNKPNTYYLYFGLSLKANGTASNPIVVIGNTPADYEPYNGNSYSVTFGDTVYHADIDVIGGDGEDEYTYIELTKNSDWVWNANNSLAICYVPKAAIVDESTQREVFVQNNMFTNSAWVGRSTPEYSCGLFYGASFVFVRSANHIASVDDLKAVLGDNVLQIAYKRATPKAITTTPTPITALKGYNAMWSDAGDIEVTVHGTPVEVETLQALNMLLGGAYRNNQTADDVSDDEALDIILGGENR